MKKLFTGVLLATVAMYVWGFLFWGVLPLPVFEDTTDEAAVLGSLSENMPESGAYYVPFPDRTEESAELHRQGPIALVFLQSKGSEPMSASVFVIGFLQMLFAAFIVALLLREVAAGLGTYRRKVAFVVAIGVVGTIWFGFALPVWWRAPWTFFLYTALYDIIAWIIAGSVLGKFVEVPAQKMGPEYATG